MGIAFVAPLARAGFADGGFELGTGTAFSSSWTVNSYTIPAAIPTFPPHKKADLFNTTSTDPTPLGTPNGLTSVVSAGTDAGSGGAVHYPIWGNKAALVNLGGNSNRASSIYQHATMALADVDPTDGKIHIRFAIAPVLQNPSHKQNEQPYFFIEIKNLTKGTQLYHTFNFAGEAGVPWQYVGGYAYTDWQALDVAPGNGFLDVGDQVSLEVMASSCGLGGHEGHVYVDSVGAFITGLLVAVTGPTTALPGTDITYTYTYSNTSGVAVTNPTVNAVMPQDGTVGAAPNYPPAPLNTTFVSYNAPGGVCTAPAVGSAGTVRCVFPTLPDKASGSFTVTVHIPSNARTDPPASGNGNTLPDLNNGDYSISGDGASTFLGPLFNTLLIPAAGSTLTDLAVTLTDGVSSVAPLGALTYTSVVTNNGLATVTNATVSETISGLTGVTWTCVGSAGATCAASGSGAISGSLVTLPAGGFVTYTIHANAAAAGAPNTTTNVITVTPPSGTTDVDTSNNSAGDTNFIGALYTVTVSKSGLGTGSVVSVPAGISCNASCAGPASMQVTDGGQAILTAVAATGSVFVGWTGACSGATNPCTVTVAGADAAVTARFAQVPTAVADSSNSLVGAAATFDVSGNDSIPSGSTYSLTGGSCSGITGHPTVSSSGVAGFIAPSTIGSTCTVTYQVCDPSPDQAICASATLTVTGLAPTLTAVADSTGAPTGTSGTFDVSSNDSKPSGSTYSLTGGTCSGTSVSSVGVAGFTAPTTSGNTCTVTYSVCDPAPNASTCTGATLTVTAVGAPTATNDSVAHGVRTFSPAANDSASAGAVIDPSTVDLDPNTAGIQRGPITTSQGTWRVTDNNGTVHFDPAPGFYGTASLIYAVSDSLGSTATATMSVPIDPSGVLYNSATRQPISGATVTLLYNGGNANAYVVGGNATQTTNASGQYGFFLLPGAPAGTYSLTVSITGYTFASTTIPSSGSWPSGGGAVTSVVGVPTGAQSTTYYLSGPLLTTDLTNNNIPLDAVPPAVASIPTLSEWGLLMLSSLLALSALLWGRRKASRL